MALLDALLRDDREQRMDLDLGSADPQRAG
jgi:hypothetical protein